MFFTCFLALSLSLAPSLPVDLYRHPLSRSLARSLLLRGGGGGGGVGGVESSSLLVPALPLPTVFLRLDETLDGVAGDGPLVTLHRVPRLVARRKRKHGVGHERRFPRHLRAVSVSVPFPCTSNNIVSLKSCVFSPRVRLLYYPFDPTPVTSQKIHVVTSVKASDRAPKEHK